MHEAAKSAQVILIKLLAVFRWLLRSCSRVREDLSSAGRNGVAAFHCRLRLPFLTVAFAGFMFAALYLAGKLHTFDENRHFIRLIPSVVLLFVAGGIMASRVSDSMYIASFLDAFAGAVLGKKAHSLCSRHT